MLSRVAGRSLVGAAVGAVALISASQAQAALCSELEFENPIVGAGGSAITAELGAVAKELAKFEPPITVLWSDPGACTGYQYFLAGDIGGTGTRTLKYWDAQGQKTCDLDVGEVVAPVFAHMGNTADFCEGQTLPAGVKDFPGPVQTVNLITHKNSAEKSISAEALYYIWGKGANQSGVEPWNNQSALWGRNTTSFVHLFLAAAVKVPANAFKLDAAQVVRDQSAVINGIVASAAAISPGATLGYVSSSAADASRETVKTLAYQHTGQTCGYWPDSTEDALDKINVRNGQYYLWTPGHFFAKVNNQGVIQDANVKKFIDWFTDKEPSPGDIVTQRIIEAGDVPQCAMRVTREGVIGAISSFAPEAPCNCYFETIATKATPDNCKACEDDTECGDGAPKCRHGYCEAY